MILPQKTVSHVAFKQLFLIGILQEVAGRIRTGARAAQ
jgi:hypothetical protein